MMHHCYSQNLVYKNDFEKLELQTYYKSDYLVPVGIHAYKGSPDLLTTSTGINIKKAFGFVVGSVVDQKIHPKVVMPRGKNSVGLFVRSITGRLDESIIFSLKDILKPSTFQLNFEYCLFKNKTDYLDAYLVFISGIKNSKGFMPKDTFALYNKLNSFDWKYQSYEIKLKSEFNSFIIGTSDLVYFEERKLTPGQLLIQNDSTHTDSYTFIDNIQLTDLKNINPKLTFPPIKNDTLTLTFGIDETILDSLQLKRCMGFIRSHLSKKIKQIHIVASADASGTLAHNQTLCKQRASYLEKEIENQFKEYENEIISNVDNSYKNRNGTIVLIYHQP